MMRLFVKLGAASVLAALLGCPPLEEGGGGGIGIDNFTRGYVFVRSDDRNVYAADESDLQSVARLTENGNNKHPALSPDGRLVAFVHDDGSGATLHTALLAGGSPSTVLVSDQDRTAFQGPVFSPDGQRLAFSFEQGGASYVGVVGVDGQGFESFGSGALSYASPSFIDDQTLLVAAGSLATGFNQIERIDLSAGTTTSVTNGLGNEATAIRNRLVVSPDGTTAAFDGVLSSGVTRIFLVDLTTKEVVQLSDYGSQPNANDTFPAWTSNQQVAFSSDFGGNDAVYVIDTGARKEAGTLTLPSAVQPWFGPL